VWALARLRFSPPPRWTAALAGAVTARLQEFSAQGLAVVVWGFTRLGARPDRLWLLRFRALAADAADRGDGSDSSSELAQFVAACLAQQNRLRFANAQQPRGASDGRSNAPQDL
jgi:hypothetical protein